MIDNKCRKRKGRPTPWDGEVKTFHPCGIGNTGPGMPASLALCLHGVYIFNPATSTHEALRQFMWAGIRLLNEEVKARGMSEDEVRSIVTGTFDAFHDTADVLWATLQRMKCEGRTFLPPHPVPSSLPAVVPAQETPPQENAAVGDLRRAFLRKKHQVLAYREELDRDLETLVDE